MLLHILPLSLTNIIAALLFYDFCYGDKFVETVEDGIDEACKSLAHSSLEEIAADESPQRRYNKVKGCIVLVVTLLHLIVGVEICLLQSHAYGVVGKMYESQLVVLLWKMSQRAVHFRECVYVRRPFCSFLYEEAQLIVGIIEEPLHKIVLSWNVKS